MSETESVPVAAADAAIAIVEETNPILVKILELLKTIGEKLFNTEWDELLDSIFAKAKIYLEKHPVEQQPNNENYVALHKYLVNKVDELSKTKKDHGDEAMFIDLWNSLTDTEVDTLVKKIVENKMEDYLAKKSEDELKHLHEKIVKRGPKKSVANWFDHQFEKILEKIHQSVEKLHS